MYFLFFSGLESEDNKKVKIVPNENDTIWRIPFIGTEDRRQNNDDNDDDDNDNNDGDNDEQDVLSTATSAESTATSAESTVITSAESTDTSTEYSTGILLNILSSRPPPYNPDFSPTDRDIEKQPCSPHMCYTLKPTGLIPSAPEEEEEEETIQKKLFM